jgi:hypothetical protein
MLKFIEYEVNKFIKTDRVTEASLKELDEKIAKEGALKQKPVDLNSSKAS